MTDGSSMYLRDICDLVTEQVDPRDRPDAIYVGLEHVRSGRFVRSGEGAASSVRSAKYAFASGDILYGKLRPYLDKAVLSRDEGICTTELLVLRPKKGVDPRFVAGVVHSPAFVEHAVAGTTGVQHPRTSWSHISNFSISSLNAREQAKIADMLWQIHDAVTTNEAVIEAATALKRSAMREIFTRGLRGEPQKETEIGPVPESWKLAPCEQIFKLASGKKRPSDLSDILNDEKPFPVLGGNGVMGFSGEWHLDGLQSLIIGRVGEYCGAVHIASGKVWVTDNALYAKEWLNQNADVAFVGAFLEYYDLNRFKRMAGQPLVTQGVINEHRVPLPHIEEQREIIAIFAAIDHKIDLHRRKRMVLGDLFKTLLHKLMTGEIRVEDLDLSALQLSHDSLQN